MLKRGIYAAVLCPFHTDGACDLEELYLHCVDLVQRGCQGVVLFGTTGEGPSLSLQEKREILDFLLMQGFSSSQLIIANGSASLPDTVEMGKWVVEAGCAAFLVSPPCYYKNVEQQGVLDFYGTVIQKVASPYLSMLLYHIPQYSGVPLTLPILKTLHQQFPQVIVGLKESEGNFALTQAALQSFPEWKVYVGNERQIADVVQRGGAGAICGMANLFPERLVALCEQGSKGEDLEALFQALKTYPFIATAKAWLEKKRGKNWHAVRPPLLSLDFKKLEELRLHNWLG